MDKLSDNLKKIFLAGIAPDINMAEIAAARISGDFFRNFDWKKELKSRLPL